jgi:cation diffusion facilitator family transporter
MTATDKRKLSVALLSVISNTILVVLKLIIGIMISSVSVISEAIHSGVDLLAAIIALFAVRTSGKPADKEHPFGHGKFENISGTAEALLIFVAAIWIIYEAVEKLKHPASMGSVTWGVYVMLASSIINLFVSQMLFKVGKETDSVALLADAWHLRTDVYTSAGVMIGLGCIWGGEKFFPGTDLAWVDPAAAIGVALLIIKAAYNLTVESARDLLDVSLPTEDETAIRKHIASFSPTICAFHSLRTRKSGSYRFAEFTLMVDSDMSVEESHRITEEVTEAIDTQFPGISITIHIEPCDGTCIPKCLEGCFLNEEELRKVRIKHGTAAPQNA